MLFLVLTINEVFCKVCVLSKELHFPCLTYKSLPEYFNTACSWLC